VGRGAAAPAHYLLFVAVDLTETRRSAEAAAREWGVELGASFELGRHSCVAPAGDDLVIKVPWEGDDESLHEPEALELWAGDGAVRIVRRAGRALLEERALPGSDLSDLEQDEAMQVAIDVGSRLWRRAGAPFRPVAEYVPEWLERGRSKLTPLALEIWSSFEPGRDWLVHGDFHHHNVLRHARGYVAIDPKPYLADREYDVYTWLHNPLPYVMSRADVERRIAHFVDAGLDDFRIRAWAIVRGAYLGGEGVEAEVLAGLLD
jgi:streptomycin 6-kinase